MGIDRIGGKGPSAPPPEAAEGSRKPDAARPFESPRVAEVSTPAAASVSATSALGKLQSGQVDVGGYLDLKVDEATAHLEAMPAAQLEAIRGALRERLATDPTLVDLVRTATGQLPPPPPSDE